MNDGLPEHHRYQDTGCEVAPACLECPLPACRYDGPGHSLQSARAALRAAAVVELRTRGLSHAAIGDALGLSERTVFRLTKA